MPCEEDFEMKYGASKVVGIQKRAFESALRVLSIIAWSIHEEPECECSRYLPKALYAYSCHMIQLVKLVQIVVPVVNYFLLVTIFVIA